MGHELLSAQVLLLSVEDSQPDEQQVQLGLQTLLAFLLPASLVCHPQELDQLFFVEDSILCPVESDEEVMGDLLYLSLLVGRRLCGYGAPAGNIVLAGKRLSKGVHLGIGRPVLLECFGLGLTDPHLLIL